jgi:hypothetical protein
MKAMRGLKGGSHLFAIERPVGLCTGRLDRRAPRSIQKAKLNSGAIDYPAHDPAKCVNLSNQMPFRYSSDGGITRHLPDEIEIECNHRGLGTESRRG